MRTKAGFTLVALVALFAGGCQNASFKKTKSGLVYKIFPGKDTTKVNAGNFFKFNVVQKINDSVVFDSYKRMPEYTRAEGGGRPYDPSEVYSLLKVGDSLVTIQLLDSFIKKMPSVPEGIKKGDRLITTFKVLKVFKTQDEASADREKEYQAYLPAMQKEQEELRKKAEEEAKKDLVSQSAEMEKYLAAKKITAQKTPAGAYIAITEPGTGMAIDSGKLVTVKYVGKHLDTDSVFQASEFETEIQGARPTVKGFEDGLKQLKKGGKATIYIPGALGYGKNPQQGSPFKPNESLIFEVEIKDVKEKPTEQQAAPAKIDATQPKK